MNTRLMTQAALVLLMAFLFSGTVLAEGGDEPFCVTGGHCSRAYRTPFVSYPGDAHWVCAFFNTDPPPGLHYDCEGSLEEVD